MSEETKESKEVITTEEAELLGQEEDLVGKKEAGENLSTEETETLGKINTLKGSLKERLGKDTPEKPNEEFASIDAQKRHFKAKFQAEKVAREKAEKDLKELKEAKEGAPTTEEQTEWQKKIDFLMGHKEVSKEELEHISIVALRTKTSLDEAHDSEGVQDYLKFKREKVAKEKAVPGSSPAGSESSTKTDKEVGEMSRDDHKKLVEDNIKKQMGGGSEV